MPARTTPAQLDFLKYVIILFFTLTGTAFYWYLDGRPMAGIDDANIYFVYMRNFAEGHGFVYNIGGERVEGFTSLLWTLIGALIFQFTSSPEIYLLLLNVVLVSVTLWRIVLFTDRLLGDNRLITPYSYFILGCLFVIPGFFDWTILSMMETGLWTFLLVHAVLNICQFELDNENRSGSNAWLTLLLVLMVFTRPESYLWSLVFLALRYWQLVRDGQGKIFAPVKTLLLPALAVVAAVAGITMWRLNYFGFMLPNTYYAKVSGDVINNIIEGIQYDVNYLLKFNAFCLIILGFLLYHSRKIARFTDPRIKAVINVLIVVCTITLVIPLQSGGDHFRYGRFIQPTLVFFYLFFVIVVSKLLKTETRYRSGFVFELSIVLVIVVFTPLYNIGYSLLKQSPLRVEFSLAQDGREISEGMNKFFSRLPEMPSHATSAAGGSAYVYKGFTNDLMGLNNVEMAHADKVKSTNTPKNHASFNKEVFYRQRPDLFYGIFCGKFRTDTTGFVLPEKSSDFEQSFNSRVFKNIYLDSAFRSLYTPVFLKRKDHEVFFITYASNKFLSSLDTDYYSYTPVPR